MRESVKFGVTSKITANLTESVQAKRESTIDAVHCDFKTEQRPTGTPHLTNAVPAILCVAGESR